MSERTVAENTPTPRRILMILAHPDVGAGTGGADLLESTATDV